MLDKDQLNFASAIVLIRRRTIFFS